MSTYSTIAISPLAAFSNESAMINQFFEAGLHRYHIYKAQASEQSIAEILEGVAPKYLSKITLHSHFHLVLAYGVGGIHYSLDHRIALGQDYGSKVQLYQGFGVKVSTDVDESDWSIADYGISTSSLNTSDSQNSIFFLTQDSKSIGFRPAALPLDELLKDYSFQDILDKLTV